MNFDLRLCLAVPHGLKITVSHSVEPVQLQSRNIHVGFHVLREPSPDMQKWEGNMNMMSQIMTFLHLLIKVFREASYGVAAVLFSTSLNFGRHGIHLLH